MSIHHIIIGVLLIRHTKSAFLLKAYAVVADATRVRYIRGLEGNSELFLRLPIPVKYNPMSILPTPNGRKSKLRK